MPTYSGVFRQIKEIKEQGGDKPFKSVRINYLQEAYKHTGRDIILYSTGWTQAARPSPQFSINNRDIQGFMEVVHGLDHEELDLILHSPGGSAEAAEQIVDYLRGKFEDIRIFVPQAAMSAATMLCSAADQVVMGDHSSLGPIDPQIYVENTVTGQQMPAHDILDQFNMASNSIGNNADLLPWLPILRQYPPGMLAFCRESINMSRELVENWAKKYMHGDKDDSEARQLAQDMADFLSDREYFKSHSRRISRKEADSCGFNVKPLEEDDDLQDYILSAYHAAAHSHQGTAAAKIIENQDGRAYIRRAAANE